MVLEQPYIHVQKNEFELDRVCGLQPISSPGKQISIMEKALGILHND